MHIFEPGYTMLPGANQPSIPAGVAEYRQLRARLGITRTVIVQPAAYGNDNRCTLAAMASLADDAHQTRGVAIVPVVVVGMLYGDEGTGRLLVLSQVILSMQLPFAVIPLVQFVSRRKIMGSFVISRSLMALASAIAALIVGLNMKLLADMFLG
jgi:hypothetical protein